MWLAHVEAKTLALTKTAALVRILWVGGGVRVWESNVRPKKCVKFQKTPECNHDYWEKVRVRYSDDSPDISE